MGIFTDLLTNAKSWDSGSQTGANVDTAAGDRVITKEIEAFKTRQGDPSTGASFAAGDEVQSIAAFPVAVTGGNFTLTVNLKDEAAFTTGNIAFGDNAATIEGIIDVAATAAAVTDWTNADINVALTTTLNAGAMTVTYSGNSVDDTNQNPIVINDVDMTADPLGAVTTTVEGNPGDEIQSIAAFALTPTSGNYTINITLSGAINFITGNIAHDANTATIETAIDVAATAKPVAAWTNGDIAVSGGPMTTDAVVMTFDGASVNTANHSPSVIANVDLDGYPIPGAVTTTTHGQIKRVAWAAMEAMGLVTGGPPPMGTTTGLTATTTRASNNHYPKQGTLQALALQAAIEDSTDAVYPALMSLFGQDHVV